MSKAKDKERDQLDTVKINMHTHLLNDLDLNSDTNYNKHNNKT